MNMFSQLPQLRVVVNSRCGRSCFFCRPSGEGLPTHYGAQLSSDDVVRICHSFVEHGGTEVKLTGGDPALWPHLVDCVSRLKQEVKISNLHVISRHPRIGELAPELATAGLDLLNISLDTLDPITHEQITGVADLPALLRAIQQVTSAGLICKINMVVMASVNSTEVTRVIDFCESVGVHSLKLLDMIGDLEDGTETFAKRLKRSQLSPRDLYEPLKPIAQELEMRAVSKSVIHQGGLGHPMLSLKLPSGLEVIIKDHHAGAWYGSICHQCSYYPCHDALMALRITADARLQFCLLREDVAISLRNFLDDGKDERVHQEIGKALSVFNAAEFNNTNSSLIQVEV